MVTDVGAFAILNISAVGEFILWRHIEWMQESRVAEAVMFFLGVFHHRSVREATDPATVHWGGHGDSGYRQWSAELFRERCASECGDHFRFLVHGHLLFRMDSHASFPYRRKFLTEMLMRILCGKIGRRCTRLKSLGTRRERRGLRSSVL